MTHFNQEYFISEFAVPDGFDITKWRIFSFFAMLFQMAHILHVLKYFDGDNLVAAFVFGQWRVCDIVMFIFNGTLTFSAIKKFNRTQFPDAELVDESLKRASINNVATATSQCSSYFSVLCVKHSILCAQNLSILRHKTGLGKGEFLVYIAIRTN